VATHGYNNDNNLKLKIATKVQINLHLLNNSRPTG